MMAAAFIARCVRIARRRVCVSVFRKQTGHPTGVNSESILAQKVKPRARMARSSDNECRTKCLNLFVRTLSCMSMLKVHTCTTSLLFHLIATCAAVGSVRDGSSLNDRDRGSSTDPEI